MRNRNSADDRKKKEEIEARNRADAMVYNVDKMLKEHRDKISDADAKQVEGALENVRTAMNEGGLEKITAATDQLTQASHKLAEAMYKTGSGPTDAGAGPGGFNGAGPGAGSTNGTTAEKPKDNVVDAEFVDVEDKK